MGECSKQELSIIHHLLSRTTLNHGVQCLVTVFRNCFIESRSLKRHRQRRGRFLVRHDSPTIRLSTRASQHCIPPLRTDLAYLYKPAITFLTPKTLFASSQPDSSSRHKDTMAASSAPAASLLKRQLKEMQAGKDIPGISCGLVNDNNIFEWEVMLMISDDCKYYGGKALPNPS